MLQFGTRENGAEVAFYFLSDVLGKKVYDRKGRLLGRLTDIVVKAEERYPAIDAVLLSKARRELYVPAENIDLLRLAALTGTTLEHDTVIRFESSDRHFLARSLLYDKQIVDVNGAKVERVNDVQILSSGGKSHIAAVDVGFTGLTRRLGFERVVRGVSGILGRDLQDELIDWRFVQPLPETFISPLSLSLRQEQIGELHPGELADILEELDRDERISLVQSIDVEDAAEALEETHITVQTAIIRELNTELAADILEEMEPAAAADVMDNLPAETQQSIMAAMEDEERSQLEILIQASEESAASLMTVDFLSCPERYTVCEAMEMIRGCADEIESITYIYCMDEEMRIQGVVSLRELILAESNTDLSEIMNKRIIALNPKDEWNTVANQFLKLGFKALPVVDDNGRMAGVVTFRHSFLELLPYYQKLTSRG
jgi:sporulation protein YlmC with PRC-barrel domain